MDVYGRVNILDGRAVRLSRGDVSTAISLEADPIARAQGWVAKGVHRLLIVDLDAAAFGNYANRDLIGRLIREVDVPVLAAGGIRSVAEAERMLAAGAWRVAMGTAAIIDQHMTWDLCRDHPGRIVISLDLKPTEELVIRGWKEGSGKFLEEARIELSAAGAAGYLITEAGRDALMEPPNHSFLEMALSSASGDGEVIAAGGVRNLADLEALRAIEVDGRKLAGVVVGREVTEGRFTIEQAVALIQG